jgi:hypothetical protein
MRRGTWIWALVAGAVIALAAAASLGAQEWGPPRGFTGLSFVAGEPVGELGTLFDNGFGAELGGSWSVTENRLLRVRGNAGFLVYGHQQVHYCYPTPYGCQVQGGGSTSNNIFYFGFGPELALPLGPVEPYGYGTAGLSYFTTFSSGYGAYGSYWGGSSVDDVVMAWRFGGGVRMRVGGGPHPLWFDFGVERHENGVASFAAEGTDPYGAVILFPYTGEANLLTFRIGLSIGTGSERR